MSELKQNSIKIKLWMQRAIELARLGQYSTKPNPNVGCVIVKDGQLVGEGFHPEAGQPHAEVLPCARLVNRHGVQPRMSLWSLVRIMAVHRRVPKVWSKLELQR